MATRNSSGVERRRVPLDGNRPRTHPKYSGRTATKVRPLSAEDDEPLKDTGALQRLSRALTGWPTTDARVDGQEMRIGGAL
ncbi:MAG TPA: hypothetical protein VG897_14920 [Terriglobales bacterium]|nr:hypothetical protein [Terriglobales bacterium]